MIYNRTGSFHRLWLNRSASTGMEQLVSVSAANKNRWISRWYIVFSLNTCGIDSNLTLLAWRVLKIFKKLNTYQDSFSCTDNSEFKAYSTTRESIVKRLLSSTDYDSITIHEKSVDNWDMHLFAAPGGYRMQNLCGTYSKDKPWAFAHTYFLTVGNA